MDREIILLDITDIKDLINIGIIDKDNIGKLIRWK